jgi:malonyl-ACP O-methyltransferase BioC
LARADTRPLVRRLLRTFTSEARQPALVCADVCRLPLGARSVDLIWSNLTLQWVDELPLALAEFHRVLNAGGLFTFTTFGPDTLGELRRAFAAVDASAHVNGFLDMHDVGDMLVQAGFADPVMDMEMITMTYADAGYLMRDLKAIGAQNARVDRRRSLTGRHRWQRMLAALEDFRRDGRLQASFDVVYGHAWKAEPRVVDDGRAIVRFDRGPRGRRKENVATIERRLRRGFADLRQRCGHADMAPHGVSDALAGLVGPGSHGFAPTSHANILGFLSAEQFSMRSAGVSPPVAASLTQRSSFR